MFYAANGGEARSAEYNIMPRSVPLKSYVLRLTSYSLIVFCLEHKCRKNLYRELRYSFFVDDADSFFL